MSKYFILLFLGVWLAYLLKGNPPKDNYSIKITAKHVGDGWFYQMTNNKTNKKYWSTSLEGPWNED